MEEVQELALFVETNQERFYRVAYTYVKNSEDALDIVHDAIVKALQSYRTLRNPEYMQTWFYRILINESLSFLRKNRRVISLEELPSSQLPLEAQPADGIKDEYIDLYAAVDNLPPDLKTIIILRFFEDMKLEEISNITSTNLNTVKSRLYRALRHLKMEVQEHD